MKTREELKKVVNYYVENRDFETARNYIKSWGEHIKDFNIEEELNKFEEGIKLVQVFVSHTKKDKEFCDTFDTVCARVGIKAFRSEFEDIPKPGWEKIKDEMNKSAALFFLIGNELVENQTKNENDWKYTQNWIAYEIGLACQRGIDVWVIIDDVKINFPIPYFNNYLPVSIKNEESFKYLKGVLEHYLYKYRDREQNHPLPVNANCNHCNMEFKLHANCPKGGKFQCPQCLENIYFPNGFNPY
mgnify:CR=1 FL=1